MMSLFKECTKYIVNVAGCKTLHPVTDLNSAEYFDTLCLVKRKRSSWFWKKDKYIPTQVKLGDILQNKLNIDDSKLKTNILLEKFIETPTFTAHGDAGTKIASELHLDLKSTDDMKISLNLGDIDKTRIDWDIVQKQLQKIAVNTAHPLLNEIKNYKRMKLALVLETLMTRGEASVKEDADRMVSTDDGLAVSPVKKTSISVDVHAKGSVESKTVHSYTLPSKTILAFSCNMFTIGDDNKIILHTSVDTVDAGANTNFILSQGEKVVDSVKKEFSSLLKGEKFDLLKSKLKLIIGSVDHENLRPLLLLLSLAEANFVTETAVEPVSLSNIDPSLRLFDESCMSFLRLLGFVLPNDSKESNAKFLLPKEDDKIIVKQCMAFLDCVCDINVSALKILQKLSSDELKLLLRIIENEIRGTDTLAEDENLKKHILGNECACEFLKKLDLEQVLMADVKISNKDGKQSILYDVYVVLYVLGN